MKGFPWRVGMLSTDGHRILAVGADGLPSVWAVERYGAPRIIHYAPFMGDVWTRARPVEDDGATKGALLEVVREAWKDPGVVCSPALTGQIQIEFWEVWPFARHLPDLIATGPTEFAALLAAWEAAP